MLGTFTTARLAAEPLTAEHLPELRRMHTDQAVMAELGGLRDEVQTAAYLAETLQHWTVHGFGLWILYEIGRRDPVGRAVLRHLQVDGIDEVEVGYAFYPAFWGRGLATEVARACVGFGFEQLGLDSTVAVTSPTNLASQHVLAKAGLAYDRDFDYKDARACLLRIRSASRDVHRI